MGKLIKTFLLWALMPFLALIALAVVVNWPWHVLAILVAPLAVGIVHAVIHGAAAGTAARRQTRGDGTPQPPGGGRPMGRHDEPGSDAEHPAGQPTAAFPETIGNQWRAGLGRQFNRPAIGPRPFRILPARPENEGPIS